MPTPLRASIDQFKQAQREHARDMHDRESAEALRQARQQLDAEARAALRRLPFGVYPATPDCHYAVKEEVLLAEGRRRRGQTLCGAPGGHPPRGHPAPCLDCLRVADRFLTEGPPPLELELGL